MKGKLKKQDAEIRALKKHIRCLHKSLNLAIREQDRLENQLKTILEVVQDGSRKNN